MERLCRYPDDYRTKNAAEIRRKVAGVGPDEPLPPACDGTVRIDGKRGTFTVATRRTCGGFVPAGGFSAGAVSVSGASLPTAAWASSLDGRAIAESDRLLVVHLVDCVNTGITFKDESRCILSEWGTAPQLVRRAAIDVRLAIAPGDWRVRALREDGTVRYEVPCSYSDGILSFRADTAGRNGMACLHYEVARSAAK